MADPLQAPDPDPAPAAQRLGAAFLQLWFGETAFSLAAALLGFALGVWVYQQTGSAEQFSLAIVSAMLPALLLLPLGGALADCVDRRWVIAAADGLFVVVTIVLAWLLFTQRLQVQHLFVINAASAVITAVRVPVYKAAVSTVVPAGMLTRANGMSGISLACSQLVAPVVAGALMARLGLDVMTLAILALEAAGALAVFGALSRARRELAAPAARTAAVLLGAWNGLRHSLAFFKARRAMQGLLLYTVVQKGLLTLVATMMTPLVLASHGSGVLGVIMTLGAAGALCGSLLLVATNVQKRLMTGVLALDAFLSMCVVITGHATSPVVWGACTFLAALAGSASEGCAMALWMRHAPRENRGGVFSLIGMCGLLAVALVVLGGGVLGERVLEPAMAPGGAWAGSAGVWLGTGKGRGLGLLFVVCGVLCLVISLAALVRANLRPLDGPAGEAGMAGRVLP